MVPLLRYIILLSAANAKSHISVPHSSNHIGEKAVNDVRSFETFFSSTRVYITCAYIFFVNKSRAMDNRTSVPQALSPLRSFPLVVTASPKSARSTTIIEKYQAKREKQTTYINSST